MVVIKRRLHSEECILYFGAHQLIFLFHFHLKGGNFFQISRFHVDYDNIQRMHQIGNKISFDAFASSAKGNSPAWLLCYLAAFKLAVKSLGWLLLSCVCHFSKSLLCHKADEISSFLRDCTQLKWVCYFFQLTPLHFTSKQKQTLAACKENDIFLRQKLVQCLDIDFSISLKVILWPERSKNLTLCEPLNKTRTHES